MAETEQAPARRKASRVTMSRDDAERLVTVLEEARVLLHGLRLRGDSAAAAGDLVDRLGYRRFQLLEAMKGE